MATTYARSFRPLKKVKIVRKETSMRSGYGPSRLATIWEAFGYAEFDGIEDVDERGSIMFDLTEARLREKCRKLGYRVVN